jgi:hypothetical protein
VIRHSGEHQVPASSAGEAEDAAAVVALRARTTTRSSPPLDRPGLSDAFRRSRTCAAALLLALVRMPIAASLGGVAMVALATPVFHGASSRLVALSLESGADPPSGATGFVPMFSSPGSVPVRLNQASRVSARTRRSTLQDRSEWVSNHFFFLSCSSM